MSDCIFHIALAREWDDAQRAGTYRISTRGASVDDVGFMHASFEHQVTQVGEQFYADAGEPLLVLVIDPTRLEVPVVVEAAPGTDEQFPHIYGPLPVDAVVGVRSVEVTTDGRFVVTP